MSKLTNTQKIDLARKCNLIHCGQNEYGEPEFMGTKSQWNTYDHALEIEEDNIAIM